MPVSRAFVAIRVPAALGELSDAMRPLWPAQGVSWVRPENLHLTLRFLGAAEDAQIAALREGLTAVAAQHEEFVATIEDSGCFPNRRRPKVIWAGVADVDGRLGALQRDVEEVVCAAGWEPEERDFSPARDVGSGASRGATATQQVERRVASVAGSVEAVELIESILKPTGAEYRTLHRAVLTF